MVIPAKLFLGLPKWSHTAKSTRLRLLVHCFISTFQIKISTMDQHRISEVGHLVALSSNKETSKILTKIVEKVGRLKEKWYGSQWSRTYEEIQDANGDLFLAVVLMIPPTECAKTSFDNVLNYLVGFEEYGSCRLNLSPAIRTFFESTVAAEGFAGSRRYLSFMQAVFPQEEALKSAILQNSGLLNFSLY